MARIRTIKPEICTSSQFVECSPNARLLFVLMLCFFDDGGNHPANCKRLKMEVFPADDFSMAQMASLMAELIGQGLVVEYGHGGDLYWHITGFARHQKVDRPNPKFPPFDAGSARPRRNPAEESPPEGKGGEGRGAEPVGQERERAPAAPPFPTRGFRDASSRSGGVPLDARQQEHERIMAANAAACRSFCGEGA